jgi:cell division protein FtsA
MIAGIVVTGGGAQMQHLTQLFEYCTGMDTRIGYPTEHLASSNPLDLLASPMFSTGIGLVLKGFENDTKGHDDVVSNASEVVGHSEGVLKGKFFNTIFPKMRAFFEEEEV